MNISKEIAAVQASGSDVWLAGPALEDDVRLLESSLAVELPASYRSFLLEFGALAIHDSTISGIIDGNPLDTSGGSVFGDSSRFWMEHDLPKHLLVIQVDEDAPYCLDLSGASGNNEAPVVCFELASRNSKVLANSFHEWLQVFFFSQAH